MRTPWNAGTRTIIYVLTSSQVVRDKLRSGVHADEEKDRVNSSSVVSQNGRMQIDTTTVIKHNQIEINDKYLIIQLMAFEWSMYEFQKFENGNYMDMLVFL